jgi:hypothetical protein
MVLVLSLLFQSQIINDQSETSGSCGANVTWLFNNATNKLTISGSGEMTNYSKENKAPWYSYCSYIKSLTVENGVTSIGSFSFFDCKSLRSVTIPDDLASIRNYAFSNCSGLTNITIPNRLTAISDAVFYGCASLANITIPNSTTSIGKYAFFKCVCLKNITFGNSVSYIDTYAFSNCISLTALIIPESVTSIRDSAFLNCTVLESVTYNGTSDPGQNSTNVFDRCFNLKDVIVTNKYHGEKFCGLSITKRIREEQTSMIIVALIAVSVVALVITAVSAIACFLQKETPDPQADQLNKKLI